MWSGATFFAGFEFISRTHLTIPGQILPLIYRVDYYRNHYMTLRLWIGDTSATPRPDGTISSDFLDDVATYEKPAMATLTSPVSRKRPATTSSAAPRSGAKRSTTPQEASAWYGSPSHTATGTPTSQSSGRT